MAPGSFLRIVAVFGAAAVFSGCYGAQILRGPINSEHASIQSDSLRVEQRRIFLELSRLRRQLEDERRARVQYQAQSAATIAELEESVRILIQRMEDNAQRQGYNRSTPRRPVAVSTAARDTASADTVGAAVNPSGGTEEELYRAAYLDLTRGNYDLAVKGFQNYLVRHPAGSRLAEVHYYMGECYYASERPLEAVAEYKYVVDKFPDSRLVPAAYLKSGKCYWALEERRLAEQAFRALIDRHPNTEEAQQAREALEELEG